MKFLIGQNNEYHFHSNQPPLGKKDTDNNRKETKKQKTIGVSFIAALSSLFVIVCIALIIDAEAFVATLLTIAFIFDKWLKLLQTYIT